eukprot:SAG31_NODE_3178_length_4584_cov_7.885842_3_plen_307_part_00
MPQQAAASPQQSLLLRIDDALAPDFFDRQEIHRLLLRGQALRFSHPALRVLREKYDRMKTEAAELSFASEHGTSAGPHNSHPPPSPSGQADVPLPERYDSPYERLLDAETASPHPISQSSSANSQSAASSNRRQSIVNVLGQNRRRSIVEELAIPMPGDQPVRLAELLPTVYDSVDYENETEASSSANDTSDDEEDVVSRSTSADQLQALQRRWSPGKRPAHAFGAKKSTPIRARMEAMFLAAKIGRPVSKVIATQLQSQQRCGKHVKMLQLLPREDWLQDDMLSSNDFTPPLSAVSQSDASEFGG